MRGPIIIFFPSGSSEQDEADSGLGAVTRRYIHIEHAPRGPVQHPALTARSVPGNAGSSTPAARFVAGPLSEGPVLELEHLNDRLIGDLIRGLRSGEEIYVVDSQGAVISDKAYKDTFVWVTQSRRQAALSLGNSMGGLGSSASPGRTFGISTSWSVYDVSGDLSTSEGFAGAGFDGRYVYFAPYYRGSDWHGNVTRYDTADTFDNADAWAAYDLNGIDADAEGFAGATFDGKYIYFAPYSSASGANGHVVRYDTSGDFDDSTSWEVYDVSAVDADAKGFRGAICDGRYVYFVPDYNTAYHGHVARYDTAGSFTAAGSWTVFDIGTVDSDAKGFRGAVYNGRYIYFVPYRNPSGYHGNVARYDTTGSFTAGGSWTVFDATTVDADAEGFNGGVYDGRYIYFIPLENPGANGHVIRYDTEASFTDVGSWSVFDVGTVDANAKGFAGGAFDGRYLYLIPSQNAGGYHGNVVRYDLAKAFTDSASWEVYDITAVDSGAKGFAGGVFDGRYIFLVPQYDGASYHGHVARFDTGSPAEVSLSGVLAPGDCGDIIYKGATTLEALTADAGDGYNALVSRGPCSPPIWVDLVALITYLTGSINGAAAHYLSIPMPVISGSGAVLSGIGGSAIHSLTIPMPVISEAGVVSSDTAKSASDSLTIPMPTIVGTGELV